jgi:hypothetical protein
MTSDDAYVLTLTDIDRVVPAEYEILQPGDPRNENRAALRAVRHEGAAQTHYFSSAQEYLKFATRITPRHRLLAEEHGTRYVQLSASYDADPWFHASVTHTVAGFTRRTVVIHRLKSDETAVRVEFSPEEMAALVESYQSYLAECESDMPAPEFDPFTDVREETA